MINVLTGETVSKEMLDALEKLKQGKEVDKETIDNLKEIKEASSHTVKGVSTEKLEGRENIREDVLNQLQNMGSAVTRSDGAVSFSGEIHCDKRMDIIIGLPAAGKSSALAEPISELCNSRIIDSDEAKKRLPEYNRGWGASLVHKESQIISEVQFDIALAKGENIVYPRVGGDCKELEKYISDAQNQGYKIYIHMNDLDKNKALGRMMTRFLETGRFIEPHLITQYGDSIEKTYQTLKNNPQIDGYSKWSNDVKLGCRPELIECSDSCKHLCEAITKSPTLVERAEKNKAIAETLSGKIAEVNEILKSNPALKAEYIKTRDGLRAQKAELGEKKRTPKQKRATSKSTTSRINTADRTAK